MIALNTVLTAGVHQHLGADDIGLQENARILDGAVHMALSGKVDHDIRLLLLEKLVHGLAVADVCFHKAELRVFHGLSQCLQIAGIGQLIQADNAVLRVLLKLQIDKVSANKAGSAGDNDRFTHNQYRTFPAATFLRCSP